MPFGLCNAPATFQRLMEKVLRGLIGCICLVHLDDVIIFAKTFKEMLDRLRIVFARLRAAGLKLNRKKCTFFKREIKFLGHLISKQGISTDPKKIVEIVDLPVPRNKKTS